MAIRRPRCEILGHASVTTAERSYSRMRPDMIRSSELAALDVDLSRPGGAVIYMAARRMQPEPVGAAWAQGETTTTGKPG